ncbi:MAG: glycosyltransferase, partial [Akkermansiaceae bacterium]|nr:glycosyltransferase [Akkermansiaceae bacterium]
MVTYGPFPGGWPSSFRSDFERIAKAGFSAIRIYELPSRRMLSNAAEAGLKIFAGLTWEQNSDFLSEGSRLSSAKVELAEFLAEHGSHPALAGVYVGNEIPADLVRWMGASEVQYALEELISLGKQLAPHTLFAYANFPSTEYLEPGNADFTAFNIYLEREEDLRKYLKRLHHVAGDRPLIISEFGLDSQRNGLERQAELLGNAVAIADEEAAAGFTVFTWSDRWLSGGLVVDDWSFGLVDRDDQDKPALKALVQSQKSESHASIAGAIDPEASAAPAAQNETLRPATCDPSPKVSAIICTRNGRQRVSACLSALQASRCRHGFELIVVDDGSSDGTAEHIAEHFPEVQILSLPPSGLSAARNAGASIARGEILAYTDDDCVPDRDWLERAVDFLQSHPEYAAVGGPNLAQQAQQWHEAVVCAAPGAPSHVMLDDVTAEHLPGCNLIVRKSALNEIKGFDHRFHAAGDDVDFCWRLQNIGHSLGFDPGCFVWHFRRPSLRAYLRQQLGYGKAERLLIAKHPQRFSRDGNAIWEGTIYSGAPVRVSRNAVIYHGTAAEATYHPTLGQTQPQRELDDRFDHWKSRIAFQIISWLAPALRAWHRTGRLRSLLPQWPKLSRSKRPVRVEQWSV